MSDANSLSAAAAAIRQTISVEVWDPSSTVEADRQAWIDAVADAQLANGTEELVEEIAGVPCRWVSPTGSDSTATIAYAHGGGLVSGSSITHREFASRLALAAVSDVLLIDYRLLPEHGIAQPIEDVLAVYRSLVVRFAKRQRCILFAGDSSGAALMVAALVALRDAGDPLPAGLISFSGAFDATLSSPSIDEGRDPQLSRATLEHWQDVIRPVVELDDPRLSPVFSSLHELPPALLLAGGDEVWRDDSLRLAERLTANGVSVELEVASGMWHVWPMWGVFPEAESALERAAVFVRSCCS
jgi:monoterpene epsilon-lactone hydrolase